MIPSIPVLNCVQLSPYTSQHEEWLLLAKKIRKGLGNGTALNDITEFMEYLWQHHIQSHFYRQERIIIPFIKSSELAAQLQKEHDDIRELILSPNHTSDRSLFSILVNFIENLIRLEKYYISAFLTNILSAEQFDAIFTDLEKQSVMYKEWKHKFWLKG